MKGGHNAIDICDVFTSKARKRLNKWPPSIAQKVMFMAFSFPLRSFTLEKEEGKTWAYWALAIYIPFPQCIRLSRFVNVCWDFERFLVQYGMEHTIRIQSQTPLLYTQHTVSAYHLFESYWYRTHSFIRMSQKYARVWVLLGGNYRTIPIYFE